MRLTSCKFDEEHKEIPESKEVRFTGTLAEEKAYHIAQFRVMLANQLEESTPEDLKVLARLGMVDDSIKQAAQQNEQRALNVAEAINACKTLNELSAVIDQHFTSE